MSSTHHDQARDYGFADKVLALRERAGLTQGDLAALLGVSVRSIQTWEAGDSYPGAERLMQMIAVYVERGAFEAGREEEEAAALWERAREKAARRTTPFDPRWFASLPRAVGATAPASPPPPPPAAPALPPRRYDWSEAPAAPEIQGRAEELATLARWVRAERCRVVQVLGVGGIGKTTLAAQLAQDLAPDFAVVYWRSLRNAPPVDEWLAGAIAVLSAGQAVVPTVFDARLGLLLELLHGPRALLVVDNLEAVLAPESPEVRYREGYEGYGMIVRRLAESAHAGCLLLTSREQPLLADEVAVRALRLEGLTVEAGRALLGSRALQGDAASWQRLVARYGGNPLALRVVGETIGTVFDGDIAAFLAHETAVFGGIRQVLDEQLGRLSMLEREIGTWLAVEREPVGFAELVADLGLGVARADVVEAVAALRRRSLLERGEDGTFTLQPAVLEYVTARLVEAVAGEILTGEPARLVRRPLLKAPAKDYVRCSQERLIAQPLLERLSGTRRGAEAVEERLLALLAHWRGRPPEEQGYGPGNVVNLLRLLRGNLRGLDLSHLSIRHAYLQGVEAQDASLAGAHLSEAVLADAFNNPTCVVLSTDGAYLAAGTATGEVCMWRLADRTLQANLQGHTGTVWGVALSGDGRTVASGSLDGTVRLWEVPSGQLLATLQGHTGGVWGVALGGDGQLVASGSLDGTVRLWGARGGELLATLRGHTGGVRGVALSGDGRLLASGGQDGTVRLWGAESGELLATLQGHTAGVWAVALSGDGELVASGSLDGTVRLWEAASGQPLATLQGHSSGVWAVALSEDGRLVASSSLDGTVKLWATPSGHLLATLQGHTGPVTGVALTGGGQVVASGSDDGSVRLWEAERGHLLATLQGHGSGVWGVALSGDGALVASGSQDGTVRLWGAGSGELLATLRGHTGGIWGVALSADGQVVASGSLDGTVKLWAAPSGRLLTTLRAHTGGVRGVALSGDGQLVASGGQDGTIRLWAASSGQLLATLQGHTGPVIGVALSADGRLVANGSFDGMVTLWSTESGQLLATLRGDTGPGIGVALSGDGRLVAGGSDDGTVTLWAAESGQLLATLRGHTGRVAGVALSADGRLVASGSDDATIRLWEAESGQLLATLRGHSSGVCAVALSGDGRLLVSGSLDGTAKLWEVCSGACLRTLRGDRRYERIDISGLTGVTAAQRAALLALGAIDGETAPGTSSTPDQASHPPAAASALVSAPRPEPEPQPMAAGASERPPTNLPAARTSFVGRSRDLAALAQALDPTTRIGTRLLTLIGVVGSGKTRLALTVAEAVLEAYRDGVWLVELAPLPASPDADPTQAASAMLAALGLHEQPRQAVLETLVAHLRTRCLLLVLDNCEHVVAACAALAARLLAACPELQLLTTSQQPLGNADETVWPVATLAVPPLMEGAPTPEALALLGQAEAVQLFVERAHAVQPEFALSAASATSVAAICRRLDGLPLAIELAAARLNVLPVEEILARLDDRFRLLRRGGRTADDRHQTLQATMDWSYRLLDPAEQALLRGLAVFTGGWDLTAAEAVIGAGGVVAAEAVLELLDALLERSLVYVFEVDGVPRYGMLETVRQYGLQQLERAGETAVVRDLHLSWCVTLAERAAPALLGPEQSVWLARLGREHDNLRAALQWALDCGHGALGVRLAAGLWQFWRSRGHQSEGRRWLAAVMALPADSDEATSMAVRATALERAAWLAEDEHEFAQASDLFAQSEALRRALGQDEHLSGLLLNAAMEARARGDYPRATALLEESLAQHRAQRNRESIKRGGLGLSLARLALVLAEQGEHGRARALYEECLALHRELGEREGIGKALLGLGDIARDLGDTAGVRAYSEESLALFRELGMKWGIGFWLNNLALGAYLDGDLVLAASYAEESAALFRDLEAGPSLAEVLVTVGRVKGAQGEAAAARASLAESLTLAWAKGPHVVVAAALQELGVQAVRQGQAQHGVHLLAAGATLRQAMGAPARRADQPAIEGAMVVARIALGEAAFTSTWSRGQTLPLEQVVAHAADDA